MKIILLCLVVSLSLRSGSACAEATVQEFLRQHQRASDDGQTYLEGYLRGVLAGYQASNLALKAKGATPLFCLTTQGRSELEDPMRTLKNAVGSDTSLGASPVSLAFLVNLSRRFPCRTEPTK